jgi:hypothetical protein
MMKVTDRRSSSPGYKPYVSPSPRQPRPSRRSDHYDAVDFLQEGGDFFDVLVGVPLLILGGLFAIMAVLVAIGYAAMGIANAVVWMGSLLS